MIKVESHVKRWYDFLEEGKVMGKKCSSCGAYEFPPVPVCNSCSGTELDWIEMKGEGKIVSFSVMRFMDAIQKKYGPRVIAQVELAEGTSFTSSLEGYDIEKVEELYDMIPADVKMEIIQKDGFKFVAFRLV
jgi:uncharacterized OB-fold protein